jgi:hypothetical protein
MRFVSGHHIAQLRLIFRAVPTQTFLPSLGTDLFLSYVQRFDIIPQPNPTSSNEKGPYPHPSTGMYLLKRARRSDRAIMGDVVPLARLRALIGMVPRFGKEADTRLTWGTTLEHSSEFWLNKYFDKELFYALK